MFAIQFGSEFDKIDQIYRLLKNGSTANIRWAQNVAPYALKGPLGVIMKQRIIKKHKDAMRSIKHYKAKVRIQ